MKTDLGHNVVAIDPTDCGSTVAYSITGRCKRGLSATVDLADCNRKIQWYFYGNDESGTEKIDAAIAMLEEFRAAWIAARAPKRVTKKVIYA